MPRKTKKHKQLVTQRKVKAADQEPVLNATPQPAVPAKKGYTYHVPTPAEAAKQPALVTLSTKRPVPTVKELKVDHQATAFFRQDISKSLLIIGGIIALEIGLYLADKAGSFTALLQR